MSASSKFPFVSRGEYNGKGMFCMSQTDDEDQQNKFNTFQFGLEKAKAVIQHYDALVAFVESAGEEIGEDEAPKAKVSTNGKAKSKKAKITA